VHLQKWGGIVPTAKLGCRTELEGAVLDRFLRDVCHALSVVQGQKITLLSHERISQGRSQHLVFGESITKEYTPQSLCLNHLAGTAVRLPITAAADALPRIRLFREKFDPDDRIINAWLDARPEHDYLEARTLKYVIVAEALIAITMQADETIPRTTHNPTTWEQLYHSITAALPAVEAVQLTLGNWQRLNNPAFRDNLRAVCRSHGITLDEDELKIFHQIRNDIVHRFKYNRRTKLPKEWQGGDKQTAIHFFTAAFIEKIVLQLFGLKTNSGGSPLA